LQDHNLIKNEMFESKLNKSDTESDGKIIILSLSNLQYHKLLLYLVFTVQILCIMDDSSVTLTCSHNHLKCPSKQIEKAFEVKIRTA